MCFKMINKIEAKKIMDTEKCIILDVRTKDEFDEMHIYNAILIPLDKLENEVENIIKDKKIKILVYCRSGKRSIDASNILVKLGYKNVLEFGGIIDWPFEIVQ